MHIFLGLIASLVVGIESFMVPMPFVKTNLPWVSFTLPEDKQLGISSVLYYTDYGKDRCPAYVYKSNPNLTHPWTIEEHLNSTLKISAVVQTKQNETFVDTFSLSSLGRKVQTERVMCLPSKVKKPRGELIFSENFKDSNLNKWIHVVQSQVPAPHYEGVAFVNDRANSFIENNGLHLRVTKSNYSKTNPFHLKDCTSKSKKKRCGSTKNYNNMFKFIPPFVSAKLRSKETFSYCRIQIIAKMPIGDLLFPGLTLAYDDGNDDDDGDDAIRIAIVRGNQRLSDIVRNEIGGSRVFAGAIYIRDRYTEIHEEIKYIETKNHFGKHFHTYTVIWHEKKIIFKVDDETIATISGTVAEALSKNKRHIELFVTVGGEYNFPHTRVPFHKDLHLNTNKILEKAVKEAPKWENPEMVIESIKVYSTDESEI